MHFSMRSVALVRYINSVQYCTPFAVWLSTVSVAVCSRKFENDIKIKKRHLNRFSTKMLQVNNLVSLEESRRFITDCFTSVSVPIENATAMADLLVEADYCGHFSHGMNRLEMYINDLQTNLTNGSAEPKVLNETPATAWVDGCNGLGAVVGNYCMDLAIKKAKNVGVGWVCAKRSNHYGIAGWYALRAMKNNLIGISMTNTSPLMAPTRGKEAMLGTNPISFGVPVPSENDRYLLDMATSGVAVGKIEIEKRKNNPIPKGWAQGPNGEETTDPELALTAGCLMPLGGCELTAGYKGYGMGGLVDILCGVMSGANYLNQIRKWSHAGNTESANLGQVFIALDPACFVPDFDYRMNDFNERLRNTAPSNATNPVIIPGDKETEHMKKVDSVGGIHYLQNQIDTCNELAERLGILKIQFL